MRLVCFAALILLAHVSTSSPIERDESPYTSDDFPPDFVSDSAAYEFLRGLKQSEAQSDETGNRRSKEREHVFFDLYPAKHVDPNETKANATHRRFLINIDGSEVTGHIATLHNPSWAFFSILPPKVESNPEDQAKSAQRRKKSENDAESDKTQDDGSNGSDRGSGRARVSDTSKGHNCIFATNAGFFNTRTLKWHGHLVSDGKILNKAKRRNASFGILSDGRLFTGYVPQNKSYLYISTEVEDNEITKIHASDFKQLVSGVMWLVRNGKPFVEQSRLLEDLATQESGTSFVDMVSARVAIGHNGNGEIILVQVDGQSWKRGVSLAAFADLLIRLGAVSAINLDGGGSATFLENSVVVNNPSDACADDSDMRCERQVTSITCFHHAHYSPACEATPTHTSVQYLHPHSNTNPHRNHHLLVWSAHSDFSIGEDILLFFVAVGLVAVILFTSRFIFANRVVPVQVLRELFRQV